MVAAVRAVAAVVVVIPAVIAATVVVIAATIIPTVVVAAVIPAVAIVVATVVTATLIVAAIILRRGGGRGDATCGHGDGGNGERNFLQHRQSPEKTFQQLGGGCLAGGCPDSPPRRRWCRYGRLALSQC
ncbi:hypothetical protein [Sphingomonas immobilis]|uniref:hypothetical protein n=1 Tax=Sphingomonas immobilis TaxID=3063997 RepID=UPI003D67B200